MKESVLLLNRGVSESVRYIGIDIGGTKCAVTAGDENCAVLEKVKFPTRTDLGKEQAIARIMASVEQLLQKYPDTAAIGVSCGGPLDGRRGVILSPPNLPGWDAVPITAMLRERFGLPAFLQNDADACAVAEWKCGAGKGAENLIFLTFGTGLGAGLILNGRLYTGGCNMAGEIGHMRIQEGGHVGYGKAGSLEGYCSGGGIAQYGLGTAEELGKKAACGDAEAIRVFKEVGDNLGKGLAVLVDLLNPDVIVIGSIYVRQQALLEPVVLETLRREALPQSAAHVRIVPAALGESLGDMAALCVAVHGMEME